MAHVPADGPLGLEGRHQFKSGDQFPPGTEATVFIYGRKRPDLGDAWIRATQITGLHGLGDADDFRENAEGREGEIPYPGAQRGNTIVYEGVVEAKGHTLAGLQNLRQQAAKLRRVAAESRARRLGSITIVDPLDTGDGYAQGVRCVGFSMDDSQTRSMKSVYPWAREFTMGLRMLDARWIWYPINTQADNAAGADPVLANEGYAPADLSFDVFSSGDPLDVTLTNTTLGKSLIFEGMPIPAGDLLHIDWKQRAAVWVEAASLPDYTPNVDMMPFYNADDSDWWDAMEWGLGPGNNTVTVEGANVASWDVSWQHTSY